MSKKGIFSLSPLVRKEPKEQKSPLFSVVKFETLRQLKKPAFWVAILLIPILMGGMMLIGIIAGENSSLQEQALSEDTTVAIVDEVGILPSDSPLAIYKDKEEGIEAVKKGEVELFFYIPADFDENKTAEFYHIVEGIRLFDVSSNVLKDVLAEIVASRTPQM